MKLRRLTMIPLALALATTTLWLACVAQSWNLLAGSAGLFSLGHGLFTGLAAWLAATLALHGTAGVWAGALLAVPAAALAGAAIGALACRVGGGVAFTLVTLILAEVARRLFLPPGQPEAIPALPLPASGKAVLGYYALFALALLTLAAVRLLLRSRTGARWRALREDAEAAAAVGIAPYRTRIMAMAASAALAAPAGVCLALTLHGAAPEETLSLTATLAPVLAAAIGGIGTLIGPLLGALVLVPADHALSWLIARGSHDLTPLRPLAAGLALALVATMAPGGLWPALARALGLLREREEE